MDSELTIPWPVDEDFAAAFAEAHRRRYGYVHAGRPLEIAAAHVEVTGRVASELSPSPRARPHQPLSSGETAFFDGLLQEMPLYQRAELVAGDRIVGPAIVSEPTSRRSSIRTGKPTCSLAAMLLLKATVPTAAPETAPRRGPIVPADPVFLEVFNNLLAHMAAQMGVTLRNTASSVNVKERLDFSCAIFTADGRLVANAPHVPVHLGAMEETVRQIIADNPDLGRATCSPRTILTPAARICPILRLSRRFTTRQTSYCSSRPTAPTTRRSAASRPARCRRCQRISPRKAC